ncbi:MAG: type II CRISPR RNA-guided endonuclease Cas9, partial [Opitutaceae bacterium]
EISRHQSNLTPSRFESKTKSDRLLSKEELDQTGHSAPHALAARVLVQKKPSLSWIEMWSVLRWYAHNRGYDGNSRWAKNDLDGDETEKELAALELMKRHGTEGRSMAETICATLGIDPCSEKKSSAKPFKTLNAAFPRKIVRREVLEILNLHKGVLPSLDANFINTLIAPEGASEHRAWEIIPVPNLRLPRRYYGGLLFGQLIPRFDNRIIARCPISGDKVPNKATHEFLRFRWAMILANLRVDGSAITPSQRQSLDSVMQEKGRLTSTELKKELEVISGSKTNNVKGYFELHPDSAEALVLDPALALYNGEGTGSKSLKPYWDCLPEIVRKRALGRWKKRRLVNLQWMLDQCKFEKDVFSKLREEIDSAFAADQKKKKPRYLTLEHFENQSFAPAGVSGRAPYSRKVMREVYEFVLTTNRHPAEAATEELHEGPLYRSKAVLSAERDVRLPNLTNNHLIRQRLEILLRLVDDILSEYANGDSRKVSDVVVEVASDLQTFSGLSNEAMKKELGKRLSHFKTAVKKLEKDAPNIPITGSLIRKCRIAMDMDWKCPFTGKRYEAHNLNEMEREHIIPYVDRPTNSLDALVLTFPWVNHLKGKRTAMVFINEVAEDQRFLSPKKYIESLKKLKIANSNTHPEDARRQVSRQRFLLLDRFEAKEHGFTQGALSQTSHLNRLSARQLEKRFIDPSTKEPTVRIHSIPGQVTAEARKSWRMLGTLAQACPEILNEDGKPKNKTDIRGITHLHHALDAVVLGLTHNYLPGVVPGRLINEKGAIWAAMLKRRKSEVELELLMQTGMFAKHCQNHNDASNQELSVHLLDIPKEVKQEVANRLAEKRVVQHIPSDQSGSMLEETTWRFVCEYDGQAVLVQQISRDLRKVDESKSSFGWASLELKKAEAKLLKIEEILEFLTRSQVKLIKRGLMKITTEPLRKVVGLEPGKLKVNKAVRVISGNYGISLEPLPQLLPFHKVPEQLNELKIQNGGHLPNVIRRGTLIHVKAGTWIGFWKVISVIDSKAYGVSVDLSYPHIIGKAKGNAKIPNMIESGLVVYDPPLVGISSVN